MLHLRIFWLYFFIRSCSKITCPNLFWSRWFLVQLLMLEISKKFSQQLEQMHDSDFEDSAVNLNYPHYLQVFLYFDCCTILLLSHIIKKKSRMKFGHLSTILNTDGLITTPAFCIALKYAFKVIVILCATHMYCHLFL